MIEIPAGITERSTLMLQSLLTQWEIFVRQLTVHQLGQYLGWAAAYAVLQALFAQIFFKEDKTLLPKILIRVLVVCGVGAFVMSVFLTSRYP
jgi:hypothetical protein